MGFSLGPDEWIKKPDEHNPRGYFECLPLMTISIKMLKKLGGDFHRLPSLDPGWTAALADEKRQILCVVETGGIELYKGNRLMVLADLYDELFPDAKWIYIDRDVEETYRSRFGAELSFERWVRITKDRMGVWHSSTPAKKALYIDYGDFRSDLRGTVSRVQNFLEVDLTDHQFETCLALFKPREREDQQSQKARFNGRPCFSQNCDDLVLWSIFNNRPMPGYFVEVGAGDGKSFSSTYSFELQGWNGICIEPHNESFKRLRRNRTGSICIQTVVSNRDQDQFVKKVPLRTIDSILASVDVPIPIDILSIGSSGQELEVLQGFSLSGYLPRVVLTTLLDQASEHEIDTYMSENRYIKSGKRNSSVFYCRDAEDVAFVRTACGHYLHSKPCDSDPGLASKSAIDRFIRDYKNPFLISSPRTGSHWLRMIVELYFERPLLVRTFFYPEREDYLLLHHHDLKLSIRRPNVIYLYRDPVDTIFSQLVYWKEDINNPDKIAHRTDLYGRHLDKWLHKERFTARKTVLSYENLRQNPVPEIKKLVDHFDMPLNKRRLRSVIERVSKETVKKHTNHDVQVMSNIPNYDQLREYFRAKYGDFVTQVLLKERGYLADNFPNL
jgi:hypothetical protein